MYIESVPNRNSPPAILLRQSYREDGKVRKRTLCNLSSWPTAYIEGLCGVLKGGTVIAADRDAFTITRSLPRGHVAAALGTAQQIGLDRILGPAGHRCRDLVLALIVGLKPREIAWLGVARAFQHPQIFPQRRVIDHLRFASIAGRPGFWNPFRPLDSPRSAQNVEELLTFFGLNEVAEQPVRGIPEGARKLLDVAMALALVPTLILLDEPTSGVSSAEKVGLMTRLVTALRARGVSAVFVEHDMDVVARFADRVAVWADGELFRVGGPDEVLADPEVKAHLL